MSAPRALPTEAETPALQRDVKPDETKIDTVKMGETAVPTEVVQAERVPKTSRDPWMDFYG